mmetsp:Transcript_49445/g.98194  ORF Transcript_49445/g.98194 Transcript_49445/m.98194 type:complete len:280 (-) Transcript_49445:35-874(-)
MAILSFVVAWMQIFPRPVAGFPPLAPAGLAPAGHPDVDSKPCIAGRCQNGWHDLSKPVWDCVNKTAQTDVTFQSAIRSACKGNDLDVHYQTCTAPCCECWKAYWPAYVDLWGRCGAPAEYVNGEAHNGLKAKEDWLCGTGSWGTCVGAKWNAHSFTDCTSKPDKQKLKEVFGLFRDRRSAAESCTCLQQASLVLEDLEQACQVPGAQWFVEYGKRRFKENLCGDLRPVATQSFSAATLSMPVALTVGTGMVAVVVGTFAMLLPCWRRFQWTEGQAPLLA